MTSNAAGAVTCMRADLRNPRAVLNSTELHRTLDFTQPVALVLTATVYAATDIDAPLTTRTREEIALLHRPGAARSRRGPPALLAPTHAPPTAPDRPDLDARQVPTVCHGSHEHAPDRAVGQRDARIRHPLCRHHVSPGPGQWGTLTVDR
ncbi:SAM-dependent methyltransferase [Streptomyces sp. WMMC500]|uniref:SAM-dependent methyltransferase n=1 Tax=Streptomyces sp. WMMC500 TaxID=3015154 RepID=UPI0032B1682C